MRSTVIKKSLLGASVAALTIAGGCSTVDIEKTEDNQVDEIKQAGRLLDSGMKVKSPDSAISVSSDYYIAEAPTRMNEKDLLPDFFKESYGISKPEPVELQELLSQVSDRFNIRIEFLDDANQYLDSLKEGGDSSDGDDEVDADDALENNDLAVLDDMISSASEPSQSEGLPGSGIKFSIRHDESLISLLDRVTGKLGLYWEWENNQVSIFRTKTEMISADIQGIRETFSANIASSSAGSGIQADSSLQVDYSSNQPDDFQSTLESLLSQEGTVSVMPDVGMIMVRDIPTKVKEIQSFVEKVNTKATTQIAVRLDIIKVTEKDSNDFGVDWGAIFSGSEDFGFEFTSQLNNTANSNLKVGFIDPTGNFSGSEAFINALRENGLDTKHYTSFGQTSNGRSMPLVDESTRDYISSLSTEQLEGGGVSTDTQIDTAVTGVDINVLPKITSRNNISMNIKYSLSELVNLEEKNFDNNQVQLPEDTNKSSTLSPTLEPGRTYMVGGIIDEEESTDNASISGDDSFLSWMFGGRKESSTERTQTIILVTPHILGN